MNMPKVTEALYEHGISHQLVAPHVIRVTWLVDGSSYAKTMYRLLCQFKVPGYYIVKIEDFKYLLGIPEKYTMGKIDERILIPMKKELSPFYEYLDISKRKKNGRGRGGIVTHLEFTFREKEEVHVPIQLF